MDSSLIIHANARDARAEALEALGFNGLLMGIVDLNPASARLELFLVNQKRGPILAAAAPDPLAVFTVTGGQRIRAGSAEGQVQVTAVANGSVANSLLLTIEPIGDYSTYTLHADHTSIDPFFSELPFKFRPGCFTGNCAPEWEKSPASSEQPAIDYLAKDYDSFRHTLIAAMMARVPGWDVSSEADVDQVLIDLFAAAGDELSDYQDRVMNEAYLATCRKRVSLARHARLMDYHVHQGNASSAWLALRVSATFQLQGGFRFDPGFELDPILQVWTGFEEPNEDSLVFAALDRAVFHPLLNNLRLYTWDNAVAALEAGSVSADVVPDLPAPLRADAEAVADLINGTDPALPRIEHLLIQERLNPATGQAAGADTARRQVIRLMPTAVVVKDPVRGAWFVRVTWDERDSLRHRYCFTSFCPSGLARGVSLFHGNLVKVRHGASAVTTFHEPGSALPTETSGHRYRYYVRTARQGTLCELPDLPLAYVATPRGGVVPPLSTLYVEVDIPGGGADPWDEVISLVHSDDSSENGDHFAVETDEHKASVLRFGNGINGRGLPPGATVHAAYQIGGGIEGNAGIDSIRFWDNATFPAIDEIWNPLDVVDGASPEQVEKVLRNAPEAYLARQLRAVTLSDYVRHTEEIEGVSRAAARYMWTGGWRTVRIVIDPAGTTELSDELRERVALKLETVRLIGEDIELRAPRFVPLDIEIAVCLQPDFWGEDMRAILEQEFSDGYTLDGRMGFFHPDRWTFGRPLHRSEIAGRLHNIPGIDHIVSIKVKRFEAPGPKLVDPPVLEAGPDEIFLVKNDPDRMEQGFLSFLLKGGRQ